MSRDLLPPMDRAQFDADVIASLDTIMDGLEEAPKRGLEVDDMRVVIRRESHTALQCAVMHKAALRALCRVTQRRLAGHSGLSSPIERMVLAMVDLAIEPGCVRVFYVSRLTSDSVAVVDVPRPRTHRDLTLN